MKNLCRKNIKDELLNIIKDICQRDFKITEELLDINLLKSEWDMVPRELVYIFFDVEDKFNISIPKSYILDNKFNTFNNILEIICKELKVYKDESA